MLELILITILALCSIGIEISEKKRTSRILIILVMLVFLWVLEMTNC